MGEDSDEAVDLFGEPWGDPKDRRGRKPHRRLPQVAERIAVLRAGGSTQEEVAALCGVSVKTLRRYYSRELDDGPKLARQVLLKSMWDKAIAGNVAAARYVDEQLERGELEIAAGALAQRGAAPKPEKLGKKEERQRVAEQVAGRLAPPSAPKLALVKS